MGWALIVILAVVGLALLAGGAILITAGGSAYYLAAGVALLASAIALLRRSSRRRRHLCRLTDGDALLESVGSRSRRLVARSAFAGSRHRGTSLSHATRPEAVGAAAPWWIAGPVLAIAFVIGLSAGLAVYPDYLPHPRIAVAPASAEPTEWRHWGNTIGGTRYAPVGQINTGNVDRLELAWRYDSNRPPQAIPSFEATPLAADGRLYICLQPGIVAAVDQDTGREIWRYTTPGFEKLDFSMLFGGKCRGVSYYETPLPVTDCPKRILFSTGDGYLMAVDAATGRRCRSFGQDGAVDMGIGMGTLPSPTGAILAAPSSPPAIVNGVAVIGQSVSDLGSLDAPSGVIRGYDAETGALRWAWDARKARADTLEAGRGLYAAIRRTPGAC